MQFYESIIDLADLRGAAEAPLHAYLLLGPPGSGRRAAVRDRLQSFAAQRSQLRRQAVEALGKTLHAGGATIGVVRAAACVAPEKHVG